MSSVAVQAHVLSMMDTENMFFPSYLQQFHLHGKPYHVWHQHPHSHHHFYIRKHATF